MTLPRSAHRHLFQKAGVASLLTTIAMALTACGPQLRNPWRHQGSKPHVAEKLETGRQVAFNVVPTVSSSSLQLTSQSFYERAEIDPVSHLVVWAAFSPARQSAVAASQVAAVIEEHIKAHGTAYGLTPADLKPAERHLAYPRPDQAVVSFQRVFDGIEVRGGLVQFIFAIAPDGLWRLREVMNRGYGPVKALNRGDGGVLSQDLMESTGIAGLVESSRTPVIHVKPGSSGGWEFFQASEIEAEDPVSGERLTLTFADGSGELLEGFSNLQHATSLGAEIYERSYVFKDRKNFPLAYVDVGGSAADAGGVTDADGSVELSLQSPRGQVVDVEKSSNAVYGFTYNLDAGTDTAVLKESDASLAALSAFVNLNQVVDTVSLYLTPQETPFINSRIPVVVNSNDGACNAFYDGRRIVLFAEGSDQGLTCGNMALINDVLFHEWGHGLDDSLGTRGGITDGGFSEGIGDIVGSFVTNDPVLAPGFVLGRTDPIRRLENTSRHPMPSSTGVHKVGTIIGGAVWDMRVALMERYGEKEGTDKAARYFFRHLMTTDAYIDSYQAILRLDDDDNDASTRSPNHCLINKAFADHGLATLENNCVDAGAALLDGSLSLKLEQDEGEGQLRFLAIAPDAAAVALCVGSLSDCTASGRADVKFSLHKNEGGVQIYRATATLGVTAATEVTLLALDGSQKVSGARSVKIKPNTKP